MLYPKNMCAVLDPKSTMGGQAFTLSMAAIWEGGLRRMLSESAGDTGWKLAPQNLCTRCWDDAPERGDTQRWMTADAIVERAGKRWVLDGKYKNEFGIESRADRFQMCAYATRSTQTEFHWSTRASHLHRFADCCAQLSAPNN